MKYMDSGNSQPNLSGNGQPIVSGGSQFGNQPQQSQPVIQTPVDSSYNDIILSAGKNKTRKRILLVLAIVVFVVLIAIVVFLVIVNSGNSSLKNFNKYANFVLFGVADDTYLGKSLEGQSYFESQMINQETADVFLSEANSLWRNTEQEIKSSDEAVNSEYSQQRELYEVLSVLYSKDILRRNNVIDYYIEHGEEATEEYINNYYGITEDTENNYLVDLKDAFLLWGNAVIEEITLYVNTGCFEQFEDVVCFKQNASDEQKMAIEELNDVYIQNNKIYANYFSVYETYLLILQQINDELNMGNAV